MPDLETRLQRALRPRYCYQVVSGNGSAVYGSLLRTLATAREFAILVSRSRKIVVELERVLELPGGGRRYWMMHGKRWKLWDPAADIEERKPALVWNGEEAGEEVPSG